MKMFSWKMLPQTAEEANEQSRSPVGYAKKRLLEAARHDTRARTVYRLLRERHMLNDENYFIMLAFIALNFVREREEADLNLALSRMRCEAQEEG